MTENVHHLDPADAQTGSETLKADFLAEIQNAGLSKNAAAGQIDGVSSSTLSQWLNDTYPGDVPAVERRIAIWLQTRREAQRRSFAAAGLDSHRELAVTDRVVTALSHAQAVGDVVLVHGQSGAGKSWAANHYCRTHSSAHYVSMTVAVRGLPGLLGRIGVAVGVGATHGSALDAESAIIARLQDRGALLVIDEAHHLTAKLLDELRCIRDVSGCGLALIGDDSVRMTLARCPQIVGRIGFRVGIPLPSEEDVRDLVSGVLRRRANKREIKTALTVARGPGGMHALRRLLARAWLMARNEDREAIAVEDLEIAADEEIAA